MNYDMHNYKRRLEGQLRLLEENPSISEENKKLISQFKDQAFSEGITIGRVVRYLFDLRVMARFLDKDFSKAKKEDIQVLVGKLEDSGRFSKSTVRDFKLTLRKFYKWLRKSDDFPEEVKWFKTHIRYDGIKNPEDMLTEEEIRKMINSCMNPRNRAFISVLYESGCRIGEILPLQLNRVKFDQFGALLLVNGKTGFRRVRTVASSPYLTEWINKHPSKDDPKEFLWISRDLKRLSYGYIYSMLNRVAKRAGINKKVNPHNHRHSRASYLANHLTEAQMNEYFGWIQGSDMPSIYVHLSGRDVDNALLKVYGIENNGAKKESIFKPKECSRCQQINQATNKFCSRCGLPLDEATKNEVLRKGLSRKEADDIMDSLIEDSEFREVLFRKVEMLKIKKDQGNL
jgi:site-specific recombinase XerD